MLLTQQHKPPKDLPEALVECKAFAKRGHTLANDAVSLLRRVVNTVSEKLQSEIYSLQASNFNDNATTGSLVLQLSSIRSNFEILPQQLVEDISALSKTSFSVTLFGRTMTGKSTLMEILTHGKGESIGKGAQRTTRDVRTYTS
jgi:ATPase subunit of ABC transporter with duplicated ATPase domains